MTDRKSDIESDEVPSLPIPEEVPEGELTDAQQEKLNATKVSLQLQNEKYLREHEEIPRILSFFVERALSEKPTDVLKFAGEFFTDPGLRKKVEEREGAGGTN